MKACLRWMREAVFWSGMSAEEKDQVTKSSTCMEFQPLQAKEPLIPHPIPIRSWSRVCDDLCTQNNKDYFITVDNYLDFCEVDLLTSTTSLSVIDKLKHFGRYGIPDTFVTDNGPQLSAKEFAQSWELNMPHHLHTTVS